MTRYKSREKPGDNYGYTKDGEITYKKYKFNISEPENDKAEMPAESGGLKHSYSKVLFRGRCL